MNSQRTQLWVSVVVAALAFCPTLARADALTAIIGAEAVSALLTAWSYVAVATSAMGRVFCRRRKDPSPSATTGKQPEQAQ